MCRVSKLKLDNRKYMRQRPKRLHYGLKLKHKKSTAAKSTPFHVQGGKNHQAKQIKKLVTEQKLVSTQSIPKDYQNYLKFQQRLIVDETNRRNNEIVKPSTIYYFGIQYKLFSFQQYVQNKDLQYSQFDETLDTFIATTHKLKFQTFKAFKRGTAYQINKNNYFLLNQELKLT